MRLGFSKFGLFLVIVFGVTLAGACSTSASETNTAHVGNTVQTTTQTNTAANSASTIDIKPNSPADTVRTFYGHIREGRFRDALFLTNLRPAIEGLTDAELKEFQVDFESIAVEVPRDIEINGEIISGDTAVVIANLPGEHTDKFETQELELRRENGVWILMTVDEAAEKLIKQEGKNYFHALRLETQQKEAEKMLNRIADAQTAFGVQNGGTYADMNGLIAKNLIPAEVAKGASAGYLFEVHLADDGKSYYATATPQDYGKSGRMSFVLVADGKTPPKLTGRDNKGQPIRN